MDMKRIKALYDDWDRRTLSDGYRAGQELERDLLDEMPGLIARVEELEADNKRLREAFILELDSEDVAEDDHK